MINLVVKSTSGFLSSGPSGRPVASASAPSKNLGMQLGKTQKSSLLESLKAEGEVILEDVRPTQSKAAALPPSDPVTLTVEEKLHITLKQDGGIGNFDLQGSLSLQILNQEDGLIQVQVPSKPDSIHLFCITLCLKSSEITLRA